MSRIWIEKADDSIIRYMKRVFPLVSRIALFVVFFWFGVLKVLEVSPASPLVGELLERALPFLSFDSFIVWFGIFECLIGLTFLFKGLERFSIALLVPHMLMTFGPLVLLPEIAWSQSFVPTLEGQYIIKNLAIIALAMGIAAHLRPLDADKSK
ncbi:MAG: hypothetical protein MUD00_01980 [Candidatus Pacebacteria bacterium]|jgi:uncharacterized membrane protein YkgB|nr:hypothetical protein [Candidatus Paceibacterota bacterium]